MSFFDSTRSEVIDRLVQYVLERLPQNENRLVQQFIRLYYLNVSPEDLTSRTLLDLYGAAISHWNYIYKRHKGEDKVRVYNPQLEQHGWQSSHTVIEIVTEDMPFLEDSVAMALHRLDINIHLTHSGTMKIKRNSLGEVTDIYEDKKNKDKNNKNKNGKENHFDTTQDVGVNLILNDEWVNEAALYVEIDRQSDANVLELIDRKIKDTLRDVRTVVESWPRLKEKALETVKFFEGTEAPLDKDHLSETIAFLNWLIDDHFTFMAYRESKLESTEEGIAIIVLKDSKIGLVSDTLWPPEAILVKQLSPEAQQILLSPELIVVGKTNLRATVHRPAYTDFIAIKVFDTEGRIIGWQRFIGLFTSVAYTSRPKQLPYVRRKIDAVLKETGFVPKSHDERIIMNILETLPREELFQDSVDELLNLSSSIFRLQERQKIRLLIRKDTFGMFFSCYVFVPRETFNSQLRERMQLILMHHLNGYEADFSTRFSESSLARIHFIIRIHPLQKVEFDIKDLEAKLIETARTWEDDLRDALIEHSGEARGNELLKKYQTAFPASYREFFSALQAVIDIDYFENLSDENPLLMSLYHPLEEEKDAIRFKLFRSGATLPLSDVVPILENMGLRIISERPYQIMPKNSKSIWINDYRMTHAFGESFEVETVKNIFQEAFGNIWWGLAENDGFNKLVLSAQLNWREISMLRAYAKYLWQIGFSFSSDHIAAAMNRNPVLALELVNLFKMRFDPNNNVTEHEVNDQKIKIENLLDTVLNSNEDKIIRRYLDVILATLRTNYFQKIEGVYKPYFSFKLESAKVPELPLPLPLYEIFVYSTRMEGIHLRGAKVARGGIRWSDRHEDFRTEILDLMKTQQVKNAVIVPMGAKGGFVVKENLMDRSREYIGEEVVSCYKILIRGLLDLTDNSVGTGIVPPKDVRRYDDDDTYLVVAADKGTATFSDIANAISQEYGFWLDDAFASGGSTGYDHKKMGITARGAWESVKRHFLGMNVDIHKTDFTVMGIGDMAGDVFGNGMLLSDHLRLVAAFNHVHIFIDPNPDPKTSFVERKRLFELPRSNWTDYNPDLISEGGGVFLRSAKLITLTPQIQKALDFYQDRVSPNELIRAILRSPVDLFFNGGIGTYVKATRESNLSVGDRANDALRINGAELRCKVVGEGGNLGFTQLGRVEYAKCGGRLNTDAIDNSGGVNCSDNEVNIKILLNDVVENGELTEKQRNTLLASMQDEVGELVLYNNRRQPEAISITVSQAPQNIDMHSRLIQEMEKAGDLNRTVEFLPDRDEIESRKKFNQGLTRPEIAVLMAYCKIVLKKNLLQSTILDEEFFLTDLFRAFPKPLQAHYKSFMCGHRLKREIIATQLSNTVINDMGISFINRLHDETGAMPCEIVRAYTVAKIVFDLHGLYKLIQDLTGTVDANIQLQMIQEVNRLVRRGTRWFLQNRRTGINIEQNIEQFLEPVAEVSRELPIFLSTSTSDDGGLTVNNLKEAKVPDALALRISELSAMFSALDIVEAASQHKFKTSQVGAIYYAIGSRLQLDWFRDLIKNHPITNHWEALARAMFRDDLDKQQRNLTIIMIHNNPEILDDPHLLIDSWLKSYPALVRRWEYFINELKNTTTPDFTIFSISLRELFEMSQTSMTKRRDDG